MAYQTKDNTGSIFVNTEKQSQNQPDYRGRCIINGQNYFISAWVKTSNPQDGSAPKTYLSLAFNAPQPQNPIVAQGQQVLQQQGFVRPTFPAFVPPAPQPIAPAPQPAAFPTQQFQAPQFQQIKPVAAPVQQFVNEMGLEPVEDPNDLPF